MHELYIFFASLSPMRQPLIDLSLTQMLPPWERTNFLYQVHLVLKFTPCPPLYNVQVYITMHVEPSLVSQYSLDSECTRWGKQICYSFSFLSLTVEATPCLLIISAPFCGTAPVTLVGLLSKE